MHKLIRVLGEKYPNYKTQIDSVGQLASKAVQGMDSAASAPVVGKATDAAQRVQDKARELHLQQYVPMLIGLVLCFFGGSFTMLIAVVETVRVVCWEDIQHSYAILKRNYDIAAEESRKDDMIDADGNGIADVLEMERKELVSRKVQIFVKSVDVNEVHTAGRTLLAAFFSVIAALRVRVARALALASSLTKTARESVQLEKTLEENLPADQKKWSPLIADAVFNGLTVAIAFVLRASEGYIHSAVRGASIFVKSALKLAQEKQLVEPELTMESHKARVLVAVVAVVGFLWQVVKHGTLPLPIRILLFPLTSLEFVVKTLTSLWL